MKMRMIFMIFSILTLIACGGGSGSSATSSNAPGGLYIGYYAEAPDPRNSEDDPTWGAYILQLPTTDGTFTGNMRFTYVGCQTEGTGTVSGNKNSQTLTGTWVNVLDNHPQSGTFNGKYATDTQVYSGTYDNNVKGSQRIDVSIACTAYFDRYYVADHGTWEMFPVETNRPSNFVISETAPKNFSCPNLWPALQTNILVYVLDPEVTASTGNPVLWQSYTTNASTNISIPNTVVLQPNKRYVLAVAISDATSGNRLAFSSKGFTAP